MTTEPGERHVAEIMERALQLAEETLEQITRIAVEQIRKGVETSNHIEAAERDMRSTLRQLVLVQREWNAKSTHRVRIGEHDRAIADITQAPVRTTETPATVAVESEQRTPPTEPPETAYTPHTAL